MAIVDFEQDPAAPYGTGNFRDESGRVMYAYDPDTAQQFSKTMKGSRTDRRTALNAPIPGADLKALAGTAPARVGGAATATDAPAPTPGTEPDPPMQPPAAAPTGAPGEAAAAGEAEIADAVSDLEQAVEGGGAPAAPPSPAAAPPAGAGAQLVQTLEATRPPAPAPAAGTGGGAALVQTLDANRGPMSARSAPTPAPEPREFDSEGLPLGQVSAGDTINIRKGLPIEKALEEIADKEAIGERGDALIRSEYDRQGRVAERGFTAQRDQARAEYGRNVQRSFEARAQRMAAEEKVTKLQDALKRNDESLDPGRYMRNMSTGSFIATALLAGLNGAFAAQLGQQRNGVIDALNNAVERDLQRQRDEIASGRVRLQNDIDRFMKEGFDAKTAETLARDALIGNMQAFLSSEAQRINALPAAQAQAQLLIQPRLEQRAKERAETLRLANDEVSIAKRAERTYAMPQAAPGMTPQDVLAMMQVNERKTEQENAKPVADAVGHDVSVAEANAIRDDAKQYGQKRQTIANTRAILNRLAEKLKLSNEKGQFVGDPEAGTRPFGSSALDAQARDIDNLYAMLKRADVMGMTREPSAKLQDEFGRITERPFWDSDIPSRLNDIGAILDMAQAELDQGYGPDVTNYYQAQRVAPGRGQAPARTGGARPPAAKPNAPAPAPAAAPAAPPPERKPKARPGDLRLE